MFTFSGEDIFKRENMISKTIAEKATNKDKLGQKGLGFLQNEVLFIVIILLYYYILFKRQLNIGLPRGASGKTAEGNPQRILS